MPSFTTKHYDAVARVQYEARKAAMSSDPVSRISDNNLTLNARLEQINEITLSLCKMFERDNPKFKQMMFIAACNRDLVE